MQWLIHVKTPAQTCFQNTELTLEMFRKISTSSCHQIPNELSNLLALVATCSTQTVNQNTNVPAEVCKVPIKRTCGLTVNYPCINSSTLNRGNHNSNGVLIECVQCHAIKNKIKNRALDKVKKFRYCKRQIKKTVFQV